MATESKEKKSTAAKNFQPLGDRLFVTYTEEMERTSGGIYVPDSAKEKPQEGEIVFEPFSGSGTTLMARLARTTRRAASKLDTSTRWASVLPSTAAACRSRSSCSFSALSNSASS